jgi:hypothetical protein
MDPVSDLIRSWKIPVGKWGKALIDFIVNISSGCSTP